MGKFLLFHQTTDKTERFEEFRQFLLDPALLHLCSMTQPFCLFWWNNLLSPTLPHRLACAIMSLSLQQKHNFRKCISIFFFFYSNDAPALANLKTKKPVSCTKMSFLSWHIAFKAATLWLFYYCHLAWWGDSVVRRSAPSPRTKTVSGSIPIRGLWAGRCLWSLFARVASLQVLCFSSEGTLGKLPKPESPQVWAWEPTVVSLSVAQQWIKGLSWV